MEKQIIAFIESLKGDKRLSSLDEASTKQAIIIKMLSLLGWDIFNVDEVKPDLVVKSYMVDYALRKNKFNTVFIGVNKAGEELRKDQKEILASAISEGVKLVLVTNGFQWWFYLSFQEGVAEQRKVCAVDLHRQKPEEAASRLISLLEKGNVTSGNALKKAETMQEARQTRAVDRYLSEAWQGLMKRPPDVLVKLINEAFEKLSGYPAEGKVIKKYLGLWARGEACEEIIELKEPVAKAPASYEGRKIQSFNFKSHSHSVDSWDRFLTRLCGLLASEFSEDLEKLLWHSVDGKFIFRDNPEELRLPLNIDGTNIFVETALNPDDTVKVARSVLKLFGYEGSELDIALTK
ncbi:MAG: hypothetical protein AMJ54_01990 [Deltaproteobacteria bacterium SG8_13]|nr:MAG: hypothetical protein AMJ54_01990 [Deltaproteobacteria bacterium SG8_13]